MGDLTEEQTGQPTFIVDDGTNTKAGVETWGALKHSPTGPQNIPGAFTAFGIQKFSSENYLGEYRFEVDDDITKFFNETTTGIGSWNTAGAGLELRTGAASSSSVRLDSKNRHHYSPGRGIIYKASVILNDTGVAGNIREWGYGDDLDGYFFRMDGTTLQAVIRNNGSETIINSTSWDIPVTPDQFGHIYYIQFEWLGVGNIFWYYDTHLVHTTRFVGTSTDLSIVHPDQPVRIRNENTTNTTDVSMRLGCSAVNTEGGNYIEGIDPFGIPRQVATTSDGRLLVNAEVASANTTLLGKRFLATSGVHTKTGANEAPAILMRNPAGSGKNLIIDRQFFESIDQGVNLLWRYYRSPTVTTLGALEPINNSLVGDTTVSVALMYDDTTTVSVFGTILNTYQVRDNMFVDELSGRLVLPPGQDILVTLESSGNNKRWSHTIAWIEEDV